MIPIGSKLTADQLTRLQARSARHIAFSLTEACPLKCSHCIVNTVPPEQRDRTISLDQARRYAEELPALRERGVRYISFTGGEPLLAIKQLRLLSEAAAREGLECTVVTACHWAGTREAARRIIGSLPHIQKWHLSTDAYHEEYIGREHVLTAAEVGVELGREVMVRMAVALPLDEASQELFADVKARLPEGVAIAVQPVSKMGRAAGLDVEVQTAETPAWPCMPNGMVVRYDGTVSPCCSSLVDTREGHPFQYERASTAGLLGTYERWTTDPLLNLIRAAGFAPLLGWVREYAPDHPVLKQVPRHPCDCCVRLWSDPALAAELRRRAETPENRTKIAALNEAVFGTIEQRDEDGNDPPRRQADQHHPGIDGGV